MRKESVTEMTMNSLSHGLGVGLSVFALIFLLVQAQDVSQALPVLVFGISLIILYLSSTIYHAFPKSMKRVSMVFRRLDHCAIYLLIAGTYTPYIWILVANTQGYILLFALWTIAVVGIILKATLFKRFKAYHLTMYLLMGWSIMLIWQDVYPLIPTNAMVLLIVGGGAYTFGVIFYALKQIPYAHMVWHFFVLTGSLLHFLSIYYIL